jgi:uncharacterized coiled-coil protein SlyX
MSLRLHTGDWYFVAGQGPMQLEDVVAKRYPDDLVYVMRALSGQRYWAGRDQLHALSRHAFEHFVATATARSIEFDLEAVKAVRAWLDPPDVIESPRCTVGHGRCVPHEEIAGMEMELEQARETLQLRTKTLCDINEKLVEEQTRAEEHEQALRQLIEQLPRCNNGNCQHVALFLAHSPFYLAACDTCIERSRHHFPGHFQEVGYAALLRAQLRRLQMTKRANGTRVYL